MHRARTPEADLPSWALIPPRHPVALPKYTDEILRWEFESGNPGLQLLARRGGTPFA